MPSKKLSIHNIRTKYEKQFYESGIMEEITIVVYDTFITISNKNKEQLFMIHHPSQRILMSRVNVLEHIFMPRPLWEISDEELSDSRGVIESAINNKFKLYNYTLVTP